VDETPRQDLDGRFIFACLRISKLDKSVASVIRTQLYSSCLRDSLRPSVSIIREAKTLMIKTLATVPRLCTVLAFCVSIGTVSVAHAALIDFDTAPSYPALVDDYANLYPGVTFASNDQWFTATINNEYYESVNGQAIGTRAGAPLSIS